MEIFFRIIYRTFWNKPNVANKNYFIMNIDGLIIAEEGLIDIEVNKRNMIVSQAYL